jgi:hypothetical protein
MKLAVAYDCQTYLGILTYPSTLQDCALDSVLSLLTAESVSTWMLFQNWLKCLANPDGIPHVDGKTREHWKNINIATVSWHILGIWKQSEEIFLLRLCICIREIFP